MDWQKCKNYGLAVVDPYGNLRLFYDPYSFNLAMIPPGMIAESAIWQGDHLQVHGRTEHGDRRIILMSGFHTWVPVL